MKVPVIADYAANTALLVIVLIVGLILILGPLFGQRDVVAKLLSGF